MSLWHKCTVQIWPRGLQSFAKFCAIIMMVVGDRHKLVLAVVVCAWCSTNHLLPLPQLTPRCKKNQEEQEQILFKDLQQDFASDKKKNRKRTM